MTVIRPNSISGVTSITAHTQSIEFYKSDGTLSGANLDGVNINTAGILTAANFKSASTNVHSIGIDVGSNIKLGSGGIVTATSYRGDGSQLTGISAGVSLANGVDNRVVTATGAAALNGESGLTYNGSTLGLAGSLAMTGGSISLDGHSLIGTANFTDISGGSYAARLGSTGSSTIRSTQIYGGGSHLATFDGVNSRLGINETTPEAGLHVTGGLPSIRLENSGTSASAGDVFGKIDFKHNDSDDAGITAIIQCVAEDSVGNSYLAFHNGDGGNADERIRIKSNGHVVINEGLGVGGQDPGGSTLRVHGSIYASLGGNTAWQKLQLEGSNNTAGDALSINNWGDVEGDYWMIGVNQTMNQSGNYSKTNSGKRSAFVNVDGRMGRIYLGGSSTSGNPTEHFYTDWSGSVHYNSGYGSLGQVFGCRAWCQNNGTSAVQGSGNISSVTDNGTGDYTFNFSTNMPDNDFSATATAYQSYNTIETSWMVRDWGNSFVRLRRGYVYTSPGSNDGAMFLTVHR